jgi:branched-chain amino acid transport system ATP-binding protein
MTLLEVKNVVARHGLLEAVRDVSFELEEGSTLALVGANGAGKTTLLRTIAGAHRAAGGRVLLDGRDVSDEPAHRRVRAGIALVPEGRRLFTGLTVEENLMLAGRSGRDGPWSLESVYEAFPLIAARRGHRAGNLSGGEQQATAIGRALMTNPRVLLMDEVSLGLAPVAVEAVYQSLAGVLAGGATVVLVEQDLSRALAAADRVICLLEGRVALEGRAGEVSREQVVDAYFGLGRAQEAGV